MGTNMYGTVIGFGAVAEIAEHSATLVGSKIYIFGGNDFEGNAEYATPSNLFKVLEHTTNTCTSVYNPGRRRPQNRKGHAACLAHDKLFILGGPGYGSSGGLWCFDLVLHEWTMLDSAPAHLARVSGGMSADFMDDRNEIVIFGGVRNSIPSNDLYSLNVETCQLSVPGATGYPPKARYSHMSVSTGKAVVICGGWYRYDQPIAMDVFILTSVGMSKLQWSTVKFDGKIRPEPRMRGSLVRLEDRLILFGGDGNTETTAEVWEFSLRDHSWTLMRQAREWYNGRSVSFSDNLEPRFGHTATVIGTKILILGGYPVNTRQITVVLDPIVVSN